MSHDQVWQIRSIHASQPKLNANPSELALIAECTTIPREWNDVLLIMCKASIVCCRCCLALTINLAIVGFMSKLFSTVRLKHQSQK